MYKLTLFYYYLGEELSEQALCTNVHLSSTLPFEKANLDLRGGETGLALRRDLTEALLE